jgi:hypothetical protein
VPVPLGSSAFAVVEEQPGLLDQVPEGAGEHHAICTFRMLLQIPSLDRCDLQKVIVLQLVKLATKSNRSKHNWLLLGSEGNLFWVTRSFVAIVSSDSIID